MDIASHPLMKQVLADVNEAKLKQEQERIAQKVEAQQLRANQGRYLAEQTRDAIAKYEALRVELHALVGTVFISNLQYQNLTGSPVPGYQDSILGDINIPTLQPKPGEWVSHFSTARAAMTGYFSNGGKWV